jgi:hypothetical protein
VRLIELEEGERVVSLARLAEKEEDDEVEEVADKDVENKSED